MNPSHPAHAELSDDKPYLVVTQHTPGLFPFAWTLRLGDLHITLPRTTCTQRPYLTNPKPLAKLVLIAMGAFYQTR